MTLIIRADADEFMGTGHVMRTLALAQTWQDEGGRVVFAAANLPPTLESRLRDEGMEILTLEVTPGSAGDAYATAELALASSADWVVADGYQFGEDYQRIIKESGLRLLLLDDYGHADHYWANLVLNQNLHAQDATYRNREPYTDLLLGTRFVLLRREFWKWRGWRRDVPDAGHTVVVSLGGSDRDNLSLKVVAALESLPVPGLEAVVLVGPANPHLAELKDAVRSSSRAIELRSNVTDVPELMAWADAAVGAAGSSSWERAFMGLPTLLVVLAENQRPLAENLCLLGAAESLGPPGNIDASGLAARMRTLLQGRADREAMVEAGQRLVDGEGAQRVLQRMRGDILRLRTATLADSDMLWRWANDPVVRAHSFSEDAIPEGVHANWLREKLRDPMCRLLIALDCDDDPVGQARLDARGFGVELSVSVGEAHRGRGYGARLIGLAATVAQRGGAAWVDAFVRPGNVASVRAFQRAGFEEMAGTEVRGCPALYFRWSSPQQLSPLGTES